MSESNWKPGRRGYEHNPPSWSKRSRSPSDGPNHVDPKRVRIRDDDDIKSRRYYDEDNRRDGRGSGHYGRDSWEEDAEEWKCQECTRWNYADAEVCLGCGSHWEQSTRRSDPRYSEEFVRNEESSRVDREEGEDVDEFGRARPPAPTKKPIEWPPCFDTAGSAFVLDARSGMFYDAESDFFYDPKSKLYYGNKKQAYYRYHQTKKPPFEEVQKVDTVRTMDLSPDPNLATNVKRKDENNQGLKPIAIKLKTKSLGATKAAKGQKTPAPEVRVKKEHAADMEKWSERQSEMGKEVVKGKAEASRKDVARTSKGEPICLVCRRKFPTVEKLEYHEKVSTLHKENMAKKEATKKMVAVEPVPPPGVYVDRAQQRRILHGPDSLPVSSSTMGVSISQDATVSAEPTVGPQDALGEANVGNKMLQKLGWKSGETLGRQERTGSVGNNNKAMERDWQRIEAVAANGGRSSRPNGRGVGS